MLGVKFKKSGFFWLVGLLGLFLGASGRIEASEGGLRLEPRFSHAQGSMLYQVPPGVPLRPRRVLLIHGGGLLAGSPRDEHYDRLARTLAGRGFETLSLRYGRLWEGGRARSNQAAFEEALEFLRGRGGQAVTIVGISSGAWVGVQGLRGMNLGEQQVVSHNKGECLPSVGINVPVDQFVGISPMVGSQGSLVLSALRTAYGEQPSDIPHDGIKKLLIRGSHDPIIPPESFEEWCGEGALDTTDCEVLSLPGGHRLLSGDGAVFLEVVNRIDAFLE